MSWHPLCNEHHPSMRCYVCTLPEAHPGRHEAWGVNHLLCAWPETAVIAVSPNRMMVAVLKENE